MSEMIFNEYYCEGTLLTAVRNDMDVLGCLKNLPKNAFDKAIGRLRDADLIAISKLSFLNFVSLKKENLSIFSRTEMDEMEKLYQSTQEPLSKLETFTQKLEFRKLSEVKRPSLEEKILLHASDNGGTIKVSSFRNIIGIPPMAASGCKALMDCMVYTGYFTRDKPSGVYVYTLTDMGRTKVREIREAA